MRWAGVGTTLVTMGQEVDKPNWKRRIVVVGVVILALVVLYFMLVGLIPRWWALQVGRLTDSRFGASIAWGLFFGFVCSLVPLLMVLVALKRWGGKHAKFWVPVYMVLAVLFATPNLMTLSVVLGTGPGAHAGQRIMDIKAPGFRDATAVGAIIAAAVFLIILFYVIRYHRRGKQLEKQRRKTGEDKPRHR